MDWLKVVVGGYDNEGNEIEAAISGTTGFVIVEYADEQYISFTPEQAVALAKALTGYAAISQTQGD